MKLTFRFWLIITFIIVAVLATVWFAQIVLLPGTYQNTFSNTLDEQSEIILQMWETYSYEEAAVKISEYAAANTLHLEIRSAGGETVFNAGWPMEADILTSSETAEILSGQYKTKRYTQPGIGEILMVAKPVYLAPEMTLIMVCAPTAPIEQAQALLSRQMLIITLFSMGITIFVAFFAARQMVKPMKRMENVAAALSSGDYSQRVLSKDKSELGDLARAIDYMADRLGQLEKMRRDFIATVSHQYKTPLAIIQGHTELIMETLPEKEAASLNASFRTILDEITRLDTMSRDMLKLSQIENGGAVLNRSAIDLKEFCDEICRSLSILSPDMLLTVKIPPNVIINADRIQMEHVIRNVCQNAILHASASEITLSVTPAKDGKIRVSIRDNGIGLTKEQEENIWVRFYKGDKKSRSGSGLGMSIVAAVLEAHGCEYGVKVSKGTEIWFVI